MIKRPLYFAYGSNMLLERLENRVQKVQRVGPFILTGYELCFNCGWPKTAYANIVPKEGAKVEGVLYRLTERQIAHLDYCEGYPYNYEKFYLTSGDDIIFGYWSRNERFKPDPDALPQLGYINVMLDGALENGLKTTYNQLVKFKNEKFNLKKGSKHKFI